MTPGKKIIELRELRDMNQTELAQKLEINRSVLNRIEQGTRPIRDDELKKFADYFGITTDELLGRETKGGYYVNAETAEIANALKEGDGMLRVMFDTVRKLPPEKMKEAANYIEYLKAKQHPEDD